MLIGEYNPTIDQKGRLNFPAKLREELGEKFIITRGMDNCLNVYSKEEWTVLEEGIKSLPRSKRRDLERFFFSGAYEAIPDKQGRLIIPTVLREYASLNKKVVIVGALSHVEIWDEGKWSSEFKKLSPVSIQKTMDELDF